MSRMSPHPHPLDLVRLHFLVEELPQVDILHRLLGRRAPAPRLPALDPFGDALLHILRIGVQHDARRALQRAQRLDHRGELHAVIGRRGLPAEELALLAVVLQHRAPPAGTRIALARAVGIDIDRLHAPLSGSLLSAPTAAPLSISSIISSVYLIIFKWETPWRLAAASDFSRASFCWAHAGVRSRMPRTRLIPCSM